MPASDILFAPEMGRARESIIDEWWVPHRAIHPTARQRIIRFERRKPARTTTQPGEWQQLAVFRYCARAAARARRRPMSRIYLVRHGSTMLSAEDAFAGSTDVALSPEGRRQAQLLGERLVSDKICAAYCSPMGRTVDTARLIANQFGVEPETRDGLREISHGHWEGLRRAEVEAKRAAGLLSDSDDGTGFYVLDAPQPTPRGGRPGCA